VTEADREAERAIAGVLRMRCPHHGTRGEELGESGPRDRRFIVDPIDGTRNFIRRIPT
jgi:histidinol-phosphatase